MFAAPRELGWTDDPEALVSGKPSQLWDMSRVLRARGDQLNDVADGLRTVETAEWNGPASARFRACFDHQPGRWSAAGHAYLEVAAALESYAYTLAWAQRQARDAVDLWRQGVASTESVVTHNPALLVGRGIDDLSSALRLPWAPQIQGDPGASLRTEARTKLAEARKQVNLVGDVVMKRVSAALDGAPAAKNPIAHNLEAVTTYAHYLFGGGAEIRSNVHDYAWPSMTLAAFTLAPTVKDFPCDGVYTVGPNGSDVTVGTQGFDAVDEVGSKKIGRLSFALSGEITVHGDSWELVGTAIPADDYYNFDTGAEHDRTNEGEGWTTIGKRLDEIAPLSSLGVIKPADFTTG